MLMVTVLLVASAVFTLGVCKPADHRGRPCRLSTNSTELCLSHQPTCDSPHPCLVPCTSEMSRDADSDDDMCSCMAGEAYQVLEDINSSRCVMISECFDRAMDRDEDDGEGLGSGKKHRCDKDGTGSKDRTRSKDKSRSNDKDQQSMRPKLCSLPCEIGNCHAYKLRYFYNPQTARCESFHYGGCGGNRNNFLTREECKERCGGGAW